MNAFATNRSLLTRDLPARAAHLPHQRRALKKIEGANSMRTVLIALLIGLTFAAAGPASAEEGSMFSKLNPFSYKRQRKAPVSARASDDSSWKLPSLWPAKPTPTMASSKPAGPSTWQKMTTGTKNFFNETADTLNPFNDANDKVEAPAITGHNTMFSQASNSKKAEEKSFFSLPSWLGGAAEEEQKDRTVNDFLMRPRPDFNN
jgi:hypothetical protein